MFKKTITKYKNMALPIKATFWYTICNFLNKGLALLSTPIFTRILTEEQYGTFTIFQSWFNIIIIFTSLNIFLNSYTKGLLLYKDDADGFTSSQLSLTTFITLIFALVYVINIDFWTSIFDLNPILMVAMFIELVTMPALEFWSSKEKFNYNYKKFVIISLLMNLFCLILSIITVIISSHKLEARVFSDVFVKFLFAGTLFLCIIFKGKKLFVKKYWLYSLKFNIPLIPHYLSNYILNQSDRIMIGKMVGNIQSAYYSVSYTISTVILLVVTAINNALTPYIYKSLEAKDIKKLKRMFNPMFLIIATLCLLIMIFAPEVIQIFAGNNYLDAIYIIPPVATSVYFIFVYSMYSTIEYYYQKTKGIAVATTCSAILNLILNYFGIKIFGYYAAGYTTLICYILLALFHYIFYKKIVKKEFKNTNDLYDSKFIFIIGGILTTTMLLVTILYKNIFLRYSIVTLILIIFILNKNKVLNIIKEFKK